MAAKSEKKKKNNIFKGMLKELKKVTWPTKKELAVYSVVVIVAVIIFTIIVGIYDLGLSKLMELILSLGK
ncbi:hypothetical protein AZF37_03220 [endosymbiont 'TC1' of Trimyema compressum]|uniref:preprotein translocase subunit SecE n=1 Tax=endosymbiont 'TC1' of Trimyema compressum TaxID=243899 RepID=UPI0007F0B5A3|nr:preprotein translocase subunit SecE [endosymbiont 'TC1' of Trimyema compressum]AMP20310.1 hypothetical protein AZF37_03220 [endosymbiont 'TC1' of Trimyema compressum]